MLGLNNSLFPLSRRYATQIMADVDTILPRTKYRSWYREHLDHRQRDDQESHYLVVLSSRRWKRKHADTYLVQTGFDNASSNMDRNSSNCDCFILAPLACG